MYIISNITLHKNTPYNYFLFMHFLEREIPVTIKSITWNTDPTVILLFKFSECITPFESQLNKRNGSWIWKIKRKHFTEIYILCPNHAVFYGFKMAVSSFTDDRFHGVAQRFHPIVVT